MPNPFDQFDSGQIQPTTNNPFDQFDHPSAPARAPGATNIFDQVGQAFQDLTDPKHPQHDPNALESGIMGVAFSKPIQSLKANYQQAVNTGLFMEPVRAAMESLGVGRQPGETNDSLHQRYNNAITLARQHAQQQMQTNTVGSYTSGNPFDALERFGQQAINTGAGIVANPQYFLLPNTAVGSSMGARVATAGLSNAAVGGASDAAAQLMDMAEGQKKSFDVEQNLKNTLMGGVFGAGLHGAVEVPTYVKGLFSQRGLDTTPPENPVGSNIQPMTTDHLAINASDHMQYQQLLAHGSVDDIKSFFRGKQGPQPSWSDVNTWVEHRDGPHPQSVNGQQGGPNPEMQPDFNYQEAYNQHAEDTQREANRQAVEQHVQSQMASWKNAPDVNVVHGPEDIADPTVRDAVLKADPQGDALGLFGSDGQVHMFSGRIQDPEVANSVLFHEGLGHYGLSQLFQGKLDQTMLSMADSNVGQFGKLVAERQAANPGESRALSAEEVLAERSQNGQIKPSWQLALNSVVRRFGRKMGLKLDMNDAEVQHVLAMAHDAVVNGKSVRENGFKGAIQDPNKFMFAGPKGIREDGLRPFVASDGVARQEFSDKDARYLGQGDTLGQTIHHPELFERYPELHNLPVLGHDDPKYHGYYDTGDEIVGKHMMINPRTGGDPLETALHETQHAIQHIEQYPDFMDAAKQGGTAKSDQYTYDNHPSEIEARATEARRFMDDKTRAEYIQPKFIRQDALGKEITDPEELDFVDRLKADPRYWEDRDYRQNVNELARTRFPIDGPVNKFITRKQLERSRGTKPNYEMGDIEGVARHIEENYIPNVMSHEEVRTAAIENGINPDELKGRDVGELATRLAKIGYAAQYSAITVKNILDRLDTPEWKPEDHIKLAESIARRNALVEMFKGEGNELGRALATVKVFKSLTNAHLSEVMAALHEQGSGLATLADPTNPDAIKFARQLKEALQSNSNPRAADVLMRNVNKPYWEQYLTTFHMNAMLSAFSTHVKAPVDMATGITREVLEKALSIPVSKARQMYQAMTGKTVEPGVEVAELFNHIHGIMSAVSDMEVYRAAAHALRTGESSYVINGNRTPTQFANQFGAISNPRLGNQTSNIGKATDLLNKPTDLISAQDTVFRSVATNAHLLTLATREARTQMPYGTTSDIMTLGKQIATQPTRSMLQEAFKEANRTLLLNDNPLNTLINKGRVYKPNMNPFERGLNFFISNLAPFIRVESNNLLNRVVQRSPLGLYQLMDPRSDLRAGGAKADIAMTRILYGSVLIGMYWMAAGQKNTTLTGSGPDNVNKYKERIASGWRPDAVHESGQYNTGGQLGMSVNPWDMHNKTAQLVASARQAFDAGMSTQGWGTALKVASGSILGNLASMSWVSDVQPAVDAARAHGQEGQNAISSFVSHEASTWVPNGLAQVSRMMDPNQHDTSSLGSISQAVGNQILDRTPWRSNLPIKYSVYGDPLANGASLTGVHTLIPGLSGNGTTETQDPAERELDRLSSMTSNAIVTPVQHSIQADPDDSTAGKISLNPAQIEEYQRLAGRSIVYYVQQDLNSGSWAKMSDAERVEEIRSIESDSKKAAANAIRGQIK